MVKQNIQYVELMEDKGCALLYSGDCFYLLVTIKTKTVNLCEKYTAKQ